MMHLTDWYSGSAWTGEYWHSVLGFASLVVIFICSFINVFSQKINDSLPDRIVYWFYMFATGAAIYHVFDGNPVYNLIKVLIGCIAISLFFDVFCNLFRKR